MTMFPHREAWQKIYQRLIEECVSRHDDVYVPLMGPYMAVDWEIFLFGRLAEHETAFAQAIREGASIPTGECLDRMLEAGVIRAILNDLSRRPRPERFQSALPKVPRGQRVGPGYPRGRAPGYGSSAP